MKVRRTTASTSDVSKPTARGGQTLVRIKMRNLLTRAVFDKTFKAADKFREPDLTTETASFLTPTPPASIS
jgi:elongation factor P